MVKIFYHKADLDGHCAGAVARHRYEGTGVEIEMIPMNYGDCFPWDSIAKDEEVVMLDFSLQPFTDMVRLHRDARLLWIDHHKSAIDASRLAGLDKEIPGIRIDGVAACRLAWRHFFPDEPEPRAVELLGLYDVWDMADEAVLPFQYGMRMQSTDPRDHYPLWKMLFESESRTLVPIFNQGETILVYQTEENRKYCNFSAFETMLGEHRGIALNRMMTNSMVFESVWDPVRHDLMIAFGWTGAKWTVSLYTMKPEVDCSALARQYGGGGHRKAAGFSCEALPFSIM